MKKNTLFLMLTTVMICFSGSSLWAQSFSEQAQTRGINHSYQARSLVGGGAVFFDYDNDGDDDLYLTAGTVGEDFIYQNNGDGTFAKVTTDIGLGATQAYNTIGACSGDIDNDGDRDLFVTTWEELGSGDNSRNLLFLNNGDATFTEIGSPAGITDVAFSISAHFMDVDNDGYLDMYVTNYIETPAFTYDMNGAINGFAHDCYPNFLYRNNGDNTFEEIANTTGADSDACSSAAIGSDFDKDGDVDILLANDFGGFLTPNELFQQGTAATFNEVANAAGADLATFSLGIGAGDYDNDQDMDFYIAALGNNALLENTSGSFSNVASSAGVENAFGTDSINGFSTGWGTAFFDFNNDGWEDIYVANGRIPSLSSFPTPVDQEDKLFLNNEDKTFSDVTATSGINDLQYSRGMAYSDFDQDGDLDVFVVLLSEQGGMSKLYVNESNSGNRYVQIKLEGTSSNRDGIGSKVWVYAGGNTYFKELSAGSSYASQHTSLLHFGLGGAPQVDSVRVEWPSGMTDVTTSVSIDTVNSIRESYAVGISPELEEHMITIFPNPSTGVFSIKGVGVDAVEVLDVHGRSLFTERKTSTIDLSSFPGGLYFVKINTGDHTAIKHIIKE